MSDARAPGVEGTGRYRLALMANVRLYREGLARALHGARDFEVVASLSVSEANLESLATVRADIVLLEAAAAATPVIVRSLLAAAPGAKVIAFAVADEENEVIRCTEAGVSGYVSCEASIEDLLITISRVARGEFPCSPRVAASLARRISSLATRLGPMDATLKLTGREREILRLIDDGLSNKEIALRLRIGLSTVKNHVHNILGKTSMSRRGKAAARLRRPWNEAVPQHDHSDDVNRPR